jgi:hypothetical protein
VLALTLLLLVALTLLAHGLLVLAQTHRRSSALAWTARARMWSAVALATEASYALDSLAPGTVSRAVAWDGGSARLTYRPLSPELVLVESRVDSAGVSRAGGLVWALDPAVRVASLPRAAELGRWPDPGTLDRVEAPEPEGGEVCPPDTLAGATPRPALVLARPDRAATPGAVPGLGRLRGDSILARLEPLVAGAGSPAPIPDGDECRADPWNWGDPSAPGTPCGRRWIGGGWNGDLHLSGGVGQGVLAVTGSLTLTDTRLHGLVLVGGDLVLEGAARFEGVARVTGQLAVADGARLVGRPCEAWKALHEVAAVTALGRPAVVPGVGWLLH